MTLSDINIENAELVIRLDTLGGPFGRLEGSEGEAAMLLAGSHLDVVRPGASAVVHRATCGEQGMFLVPIGGVSPCMEKLSGDYDMVKGATVRVNFLLRCDRELP